jgi:hypothetical protein
MTVRSGVRRRRGAMMMATSRIEVLRRRGSGCGQREQGRKGM